MESNKIHEQYMQRCIELARQALGSVAPNPMVGSVVVHNNKIIGEGYHREYGKAHAEVNAIDSVKDKELLSNSTLYVNLEPCAHFGKTPPCADLIIQHKIPKVVIATIDPFSKVAGKGIEKLKNANIEVITGILEKDGWELNKRFFTFHEKKRPYIILKWAQTEDGFIDIIRDENTKNQPNWITNEDARVFVHKLRSEEQAIMVGTTTALLDNPKLNVRNWVGKNPTRVVIDKTLRLPINLNLFDNSIKTLIFSENKNKAFEQKNEIIVVPFGKEMIISILKELNTKQIQSIIIEGGCRLINQFIFEDYWDEAIVFTGKKKFHKGIIAPKINSQTINRVERKDYYLEHYINY